MLAYVIVTFTKKHKDKERTIGLDFLLILWMIVFTMPVMVLLALQSDLGTAMVFVAIFAGLVLLSGVSWKIIIPIFCSSCVGDYRIPSNLYHKRTGVPLCTKLGCRHIRLIVSLLGSIPLIMPKRLLINRLRVKLRLVAVEFFGQGFNVSNLLIPVRESDMIFTVIAEDFGFIGSVVPKDYTFINSINVLIIVVFGGLGSITGAIVAAIVLGILNMFLQDVASVRMIIYALA